jgi:CubicO group peptidase (beta-lactamase class C family)
MRSAIVCLVTTAWALAQEPGQQVDKLFERFSSESPGCAVGVVRDGKPLFSKGYGMADLEHDAPLTAESMFYMASVSKQFTAMSILMLVDEGKIQLNDSIRKTIPELPEYTNSITLYQLLTHTSGVRDYLSLGSLAGQPMDSVFTDRRALASIARQEALNFPPGSEYSYSNSGYVLLSLVVKRVAGKNLNQFAQEKIFGPLEMKSTRFQHDHSALVPRKAFGYVRKGEDWHVSNSMLDVVGDGGLYSSVADMLHWLGNFDQPKIGKSALAAMQTHAKLSSGKEIDYGMGLAPGEYRDLRTVEHSGALGGYRTQVLWFPAQKFSVVCLCNNGTVSPVRLARQVAEIYLSSDMKPAQPRTQQNGPGIELTSAEIHAKAGLYHSDEAGYVEIAEKEGRLYSRGMDALIAIDKQRFTMGNSPAGWALVFDDHSPPASFEIRSQGKPATRFDRVKTVTLSEEQMKAYTGEFTSRELGATYRIKAASGTFTLEQGDAATFQLLNAGPGRMRTEMGGLELVFRLNSAGKVNGFDLSAGGVRNLRFERQ